MLKGKNMSSNAKSTIKTQEIDLFKLIKACLDKWWIIAVATLLTASIAFVFTDSFIAPTYKSNVMIYVNNSEMDEDRGYISSSDISASIQLVNWCETILKTRDTLTSIMEMTDKSYSFGSLSTMLKTTPINNTPVFSVVVTAYSPDEAYDIAKAIGDIFPSIIREKRKNADAVVVEHAIKPVGKSGPSLFRNTAIGAIIGLFFSIAVVCVLDLFDKKIHSVKDIGDITDLPILALIPEPDFAKNRKNKKKQYRV